MFVRVLQQRGALGGSSTSGGASTSATTPSRRSTSGAATVEGGGSQPRGAKAILVSGIADKAMEAKIENLKGKLEEAPAQCTHLVTEAVGNPKRVKYTAKVLAVVALGGRPVVDRKWVDESSKKGEWLPVDKYLIKDDPQFDLSGSLTSRGRVFEGCHFLRLKDFELPEVECKMVIESGGGSFTANVKEATVDTIVLAVRGTCVCVSAHRRVCVGFCVCLHICMYTHSPFPPSLHIVGVQGEKDWDAFKKSKSKKAPWSPASELQKKVHALSLHPSRVWCTRQCACECACARACARAYACLYACPYRKVERW